MAPWVYNATEAVCAESKYKTIIAVALTLNTLAVLTVGLRVFVRIKLLNHSGWDDCAAVFSAACSVVYTTLTIVQSRYGLGLPLTLRPPENVKLWTTTNFAGRPFYMLGLMGFKVALCLGYLRILSRGKKTYRQVIWGVMIACVVSHVVGTLFLVLVCLPLKKSWEPYVQGVCLPTGTIFYTFSATSIFFDVLIFFLPMPFLRDLQMSDRKKYGLMALFLLGLFTTVCSILRIVQIIAEQETGDLTYLVLWSAVELNIILTCLPVIKTLYPLICEKLYSKKTRTQPSTTVLEDKQAPRHPGKGIKSSSTFSRYRSDKISCNESQLTIWCSPGESSPTLIDEKRQTFNSEIEFQAEEQSNLSSSGSPKDQEFLNV
ncbi:hypothetical protein G7Y89_g12788 [Cudoniella acicularis]|uniref:Rhodopsin domain-containing protein n=1 Tax=Cudoniella acicularis TaxID=354080 RepID=A0A8H4RAR8_9HELO|nr:hypothetical protein G7Y89_g12788 [Cudoniella acicularis]